ncbi:putative major facilitator superfamily transporter [Nocardia asteroides NBRC 15531]|uniref:Major facilitator superfamily transporter n=1 Tax=Nocardia asteroides NBRC 15531 TaxID=1110697 RepID=U5ENF4_NOCAS|nr:putative major facilitator superfamily transporter [Nocardia asteroides NBRC 15531]
MRPGRVRDDPRTVESVTPATIDRKLRAARAAVFGTFTLNGFLLAMWVVHIPAITDRTGVSASLLGMFVLLLASAAIVGMRLAGPAADRFGSRTLVALAATGISVTVLGPALATGPVTLAVALACFGLGNGALDVSMNTQAVHVERAYHRPIMSAFHAMFSGGGFAGALVGAATLRMGWSPQLTLACASVAGLAVTALVVPRLLPSGEPETGSRAERYDTTADPDETSTGRVRDQDDTAKPTHTPTGDTRQARDRHRRTTQVVALGTIAFVLLLAEGVAADWSALQAREHLDVSESDAALAFGAFSATMTLGRFLADRVSGAFGPVAIVRYGSLLAAAGFAVVIASPWLPVTLIGWAMCGFGLAGGVPQIFTAAGNLGGSTAATDMSRVFTIGYLGLLAGPAVIGWLTALVPLTAALAVPLVLTLACAARAEVVSR